MSLSSPSSTRPHHPQLQTNDKAACTTFLRRLIQTPGLSGQEAAVAQLVANEMQQLGVREIGTDRIGNVIGRYGRSGGPILLLNAHMDTVGVGDPGSWTHPPYGAEMEDGLVYGRGSVDMKGALAAMVHALGLLVRNEVDLPGEMVVAAVVQEEPTEGMAMRVLVEQEQLRPDWVILGEPTSLELARGQRGRMEIQVSITGRSCHASAPDQGENALYSAARLIFGIEILNDNLMQDPVLGTGTIAATQLSTVAGSRNVIPDRCDLVIDRRLTLGETATRALAEIEDLMRREGIRGTAQVGKYRSTSYTGFETEGSEIYPAWLLPENHALLTESAASLSRSLGRKPVIKTWPFSTDGVYAMGEAGIPTIGFGPGDERLAHTADEAIRVDDVHTAAQAYADLTIDLLNYLAH